MRNLKKLVSSLILALIIGFVLIGTACNQTATDNEIKSQVSENGEPRLVVQLGHSGGISSAVYSPDGKYIVSGGIDDKVAILWEASTGREIRRFIGHTNQINSVAFSPDGKFVLTGSGQNEIDFEVNNKITKDCTIRLWDIVTGIEIKKFEGHTSKVNSVTFSPDGKYILTGSNDKTARLWSFETGKEIKKVGEHNASINSVKFSSNGKYIATGNGDVELSVNAECEGCVAKVFDTASMKLLYQFSEHTDPVGSVTFSSDSKFLLTANFTPESDIHLMEEGKYKPTNGVYQWNVENGSKVFSYTGFAPAEFSSDSSLIITAGAGATGESLQIWDAKTGERKIIIRGYKFQFPEGTIGIGDEYNGVGQTANFSSDKSSVLVGFDSVKSSGNFVYEWGEKSLYIVDINSGERKLSLNGDVEKFQNTSLVIGVNPITESNQFIQIGENVWDKSNGNRINLEKNEKNVLFQTPQLMSKDGSLVLSGLYNKKSSNPFSIGIWETKSGTQISQLPAGYGAWFSQDKQYVLLESAAKDNECQEYEHFILKYFDIKTRKLKWQYCLDIASGGPNSRYLSQDRTYSILSPDGRFVYVRVPKNYLAETEREGELNIISTDSGQLVRRIQTSEQDINQGTIISASGNYIAFSDYNYGKEVLIVDVKAGKVLHQIKLKNAIPVAFSPNDKFLAIQVADENFDSRAIQIFDVSTAKLVRELTKTNSGAKVQFTSDSSKLILESFGLFDSDGSNVKLINISTGKEIYKFEHFGEITSSVISIDGRLVITSGTDGVSKIWNIETGKELCRLTSFQNGDWIVTTPDGRFDTNNLDKVEGMHWIMPGEPLRPLPIEIFMRQHYEPRLLARVLKCNEEKNCEREFKSLPALNSLNRTQPNVKITDIKPDTEGTVEVTVEVANAKSEGQKDTFGSPLESGVYDVRLFRDGQLVGYAPKTNQTKQSTWEWIKSWFVKSSNTISNKVELDKDGKATLKFSKIKLPRTGIDKLEFSAYAFNSDQIKSETSRRNYGLNPQTVKGRAYIISMGVNYTEKPNSNLRFTANDAQQMQENLSKRLIEQGVYEEVVKIPLISDYTVNADGKTIASKAATSAELKTGQITVIENTATKSHFKAVFDVLGGKTADGEILKTIKNSEKLRQANPEDLIVISVSSHGNNDDNGVFYLLASDGETISSDELSLWLRDVDGGEISLIIDACRSASAVETADFKPAPMNSRSLGQLSYDKGMRILTATQADNVALETNETRQGLLSYALLQNGLNEFRADFKPQDNRIVMSEWLNFGVERVPRLWEESQAGQVKIVRETNDTSEAESQQRQEKTQQPSLFDFSRKRQDTTLEKRNGKLTIPTVVESPKIKPVSTPKLEVSPMSNNSPNPLPTGFNGRVIKYDTVIVRASDSEESAKLGEVLRNDPIKIGERKGKWFRVTTVSGIEGWMHGNSLEFIKQ